MTWDVLDRRPHPLQRDFRATLDYWNLPWSKEKQIINEPVAERLGFLMDGIVGRLGSSLERQLADAALGLFLIGRPLVERVWLQIFGGREVHGLQARRCLFSTYSDFWSQVACAQSRIFLRASSVREMLSAICLMPLRFTNLRASISPVVTASDACSTGGALVRSTTLTTLGLAEAAA